MEGSAESFGSYVFLEERMKTLCSFLFLVFILAVGALSGCGSSRQLQSLSVSPASTAAQGGQAQFTATGQFSSMPMSVSPASVSWWQSRPVVDPPSVMFGLGLTNQPFAAQCLAFSGPITITAIAPMDPGNTSPSISSTTFAHLVLQHTATQESGFVAATATMNCP
jgi:Mn2+/Fe2+ NRAMP family transporter